MDCKISRRTLLGGVLLAPFVAAELPKQAFSQGTAAAGPFTLPPLMYRSSALEPHIDTQTMQFHHDKHHAAYVKNLNDVVAKTPELSGKTLEDLLRNLNAVPEAARATVRNNAGGHYNHTMFWAIMKPQGGLATEVRDQRNSVFGGGGPPTGPIADAITGTFGTFGAFQTAFNDAGTKRFGSGWVWLVKNRDGKLAITSTANQDNPLSEGAFPILGNDVWEHAYYLKYQNRRADYLKAWWNVVNWDEVNRRLTAG